MTISIFVYSCSLCNMNKYSSLFSLVLCLLFVFTSSTLNDDFCDDMRYGNDEKNTSACSLVQASPKFVCTRDGINEFMIPTSRVNDGICDCCDGRDEVSGSYASHCSTNTCAEQLILLRKEALINYRQIQSGLRAKAELLSTWRTKKAQESRSLQSLRDERAALINYRFDLRYLLQYKESSRESSTRWELIREREHNCALGNVESCEYFHRGYLNDQELLDSDMEDETTPPKNPLQKRKRFVYQYTKQEIDYFQQGKGLDRVRATICPIKDVLPDEKARTTFVKLGDYYDYMFTQAEKSKKMAQDSKRKAATQIPLRKLRKYNTLFGRYLEFGEAGYRTAAITIFELVGLLFSPVTLSYHGLAWMGEEVSRFAWESLELCATNLPTLEANESISNNGTNAYSFVLQSVKAGCELILDAEVEGTPTFNLLQHLDPLRNSFILQTLDYFFDTFETFFWSLEIIQRAPFLYFEWYVNAKYQVLPPRRQACLLREALTVLENEMSVLEEKIAKEEEILALQSKGVEEQLQFKHNKATSTKNDKSTTKTTVLLDYAPDGSWESLSQQCSSLVDGEYNYTLCLFDEAKQHPTNVQSSSGTSLGLFSHWGSEDLRLQHLPQVKEYLMQMEAAAQQRKASAAGGVTAVLYDLHGVYKSLVTELPKAVLTSLTAVNNIENEGRSQGKNQEMIKQQLETQLRYYYTTQLYEHGQRCPVGQSKQRSTLVTFVCGADFKILSINEPSVCAYEMKVSLPLACDVALEEQAMSRMKSLGVFGF